MSERTGIEWTDATWNPVTGCTKVSPGCNNCYAETFAERFRGVPGHPYEQGFDLRLWPYDLAGSRAHADELHRESGGGQHKVRPGAAADY
jgi:DNA repair photolyase